MTADCCGGLGCGCNNTSIYTDRECPLCGKKLRVTGDLQTLKLSLNCANCGYHSQQLTMDEVRALID